MFRLYTGGGAHRATHTGELMTRFVQTCEARCLGAARRRPRRASTTMVLLMAGMACGSTDTQSEGERVTTSSAAATQRGEPFGVLPNGDSVSVYTLHNGDVSMRVMDYGGIVLSLETPDRQGTRGDIVLGYDHLDGYLRSSPYFGALIGRYGNRIANGRFMLGGEQYTVSTNDGPNSLHGGIAGFDKARWNVVVASDTSLTLRFVSRDGDEGFPGALTATVTYTLTDDNAWLIDYDATTDKATPVNLTQHTYWNLSGNGAQSILDHELLLEANAFTPVNATLIPTGALQPVVATPFDFRTATPIGARIGADNAQLRYGGGYDHNFVLSGERDDAGFARAALVMEPSSGRTLEVYTTEPGIQFYSGNFLDGTITGKRGAVYTHRTGFCLETQHFPDSPNQAAFPSAILQPGDTLRSRTRYVFGVVP
jgi:aldose 1-epimerase